MFNLYFFLQTVLEYYDVNIQSAIFPEQRIRITIYSDFLFSITLLVITWFGITWLHQLGKQTVSRRLSIPFLGAGLLAVGWNIVLLLERGASKTLRPFLDIMLVYVALFHLAIIVSSLIVRYGGPSREPPGQRTMRRRISLFFLVMMTLSLSLLILFHRRIIPLNLSFYGVFFILNLLPIHLLEKTARIMYPQDVSPMDSAPAPSPESLYDQYGITRREQEIIALVTAGRSNRQIEEILFISLATVKDHIYKIYQKTGVKNRVQLVNLFRHPEPGNGTTRGSGTD